MKGEFWGVEILELSSGIVVKGNFGGLKFWKEWHIMKLT